MKFFEQNCIVKWAIFFPSFCWLWDFLLENLKLKRNSEDVHWYIWVNIKQFYTRNNIFKKWIPNMTFWIIYIFVQISFLGTALGRFSKCFLFNFSSLANHGDQHFYSTIIGGVIPLIILQVSVISTCKFLRWIVVSLHLLSILLKLLWLSPLARPFMYLID